MHRLFLFVLGLWSLACGPNEDAESCPGGRPVAVFGPELAGLSGHRFSAEGQRSSELIRTSDGWQLELRQSGCENIVQDYTFILPAADTLTALGGGAAAAPLFYRLGALGPDLLAYQDFARALEARRSELTDGREVTLVPGMRARVDRIGGAEEVIYRVVLRQGQPE